MTQKKKSQLRDWIESIVIAVIIATVMKGFIIDTIQVDGSSMVPTLHHRERLLVNKIGYAFGEIKRGDIVIFQYPADLSLTYVKRIIAVGGDTVEIKDNRLYLNGQVLEEPYIMDNILNDYRKTRVPENKFFVMGDNRNYSKDSRYSDVGFVPRKNIKGKAILKIWPFPLEKVDKQRD